MRTTTSFLNNYHLLPTPPINWVYNKIDFNNSHPGNCVAHGVTWSSSSYLLKSMKVRRCLLSSLCVRVVNNMRMAMLQHWNAPYSLQHLGKISLPVWMRNIKKAQMATVLNAVYCILHVVTQLYFSRWVDPSHQEHQVIKNKIELLQLHHKEQISCSLLTSRHIYFSEVKIR